MDSTKVIDICRDIIDRLKSAGYAIPEAIKRRDRREPKRREKEIAEDKLYKLLRRMWRKQKTKIEQWLQTYSPAKKDIGDGMLPDDDWQDDEDMQDLIILLTNSARDGIDLFSQEVLIGMDYTLTNDKAARWARQYAFDLVRGIDNTTRQILRNAVSDFVETPGMTIGDIVSRLPYDEQRALRIAVTETTRAYARGQMQAGEDLQEMFPNMRVVKRWYTNNDDIVCTEICEPLDGEVVDLEEDFPGGIPEPPAHVNCRCWLGTTTRFADEE